MCLLFFMYGDDRIPFLLANNRDERYDRETIRGNVKNGVTYYPQDAEAGGTWIAFSSINGRFAVILNFHDFRYFEHWNNVYDSGKKLSRGNLPIDFVTRSDCISAFDYVHQIPLHQYTGFNLIVGDCNGCYYVSNRSDKPVYISPKILYGISNGKLDDVWPKVQTCIPKIQDVISTIELNDIDAARRSITSQLYNIMSDNTPLPDSVFGSFASDFMTRSAVFVSPTDVCGHIFGTRTITICVGIKCDEITDSLSDKLLISEFDLDTTSMCWSKNEHWIPFLFGNGCEN